MNWIYLQIVPQCALALQMGSGQAVQLQREPAGVGTFVRLSGVFYIFLPHFYILTRTDKPEPGAIFQLLLNVRLSLAGPGKPYRWLFDKPKTRNHVRELTNITHCVWLVLVALSGKRASQSCNQKQKDDKLGSSFPSALGFSIQKKRYL